MIADIVSRPGSSILHGPSFLRNLLGFSNQGIDPYLEFLILSLEKTIWAKLAYLLSTERTYKVYDTQEPNYAPSLLSYP
jgi:hypothetical protein